MAGRARSVFITLTIKIQRTEDDEDDFHLVDKRFKRKDGLDNIQAGLTAFVATLESKI